MKKSLKAIDLNMLLTFEIMKFKNMSLTKNLFIFNVLKNECIIYIMYDQDIILKYLNLKHNCKLNFKNVKFELINLHM